jgi:oligoendopeptidase F
MRRDEDNANAAYQALTDRAMNLYVQFQSESAFIAPELLACPEGFIDSLTADQAFADYSAYLLKLLRDRPHTLSEREETLIAMTGEMGASPDTIYSMLSDADMKFPKIKDERGEDVEVTHANFIPLMMNEDRAVRKAAFDALYTTHRAFSSTIPAIYAASVKADIFYARAAKFPSCRAAKLHQSAIPEAVYDNLIDAAHAHLPSLNRFVTINARLIGLEKPAMYDLYVPAVRGFDVKLPFEEAYALTVDCLAPLGAEYQNTLRAAREQRWIDPYPSAGKSSGAYSWGTYDAHPYVLMNYHEDLDSLQTIAHELGHAMHSYLSNRHQPYEKAEYSLFVAEVASTVNDVLVLFELMQRHTAREAQAYLLNRLLDSYRTTLFRQTMFAEFEASAHAMAERGEALTAESLGALYGALNDRYYAGCERDELIKLEWMRIPHFYNSFYVYQYATGFSAAMALAKAIREEGESAVKRYKAFLSAGGSVLPIDALKLAGIDMSQREPVENALSLFDEFVDRYERVAL